MSDDAEVAVLQSQMRRVEARLKENGDKAELANEKIDALSNQLKGANFLFGLCLALGGALIGWLISLGFLHR